MQADRYLDSLFAAFDFLAEFPMASPERKDVQPPIRTHVSGVHIIVYRPEDAGVSVLRVRHGRENWRSRPLG